jgi:hypothetical protein|tara:strand:- start:20 stop:598 length:579 start_codon:yes stop_codon:yes gene_type:complete
MAEKLSPEKARMFATLLGTLGDIFQGKDVVKGVLARNKIQDDAERKKKQKEAFEGYIKDLKDSGQPDSLIRMAEGLGEENLDKLILANIAAQNKVTTPIQTLKNELDTRLARGEITREEYNQEVFALVRTQNPAQSFVGQSLGTGSTFEKPVQVGGSTPSDTNRNKGPQLYRTLPGGEKVFLMPDGTLKIQN